MLITDVLHKRVGQYVGLYRDATLTFGQDLTFRVIAYGAEGLDKASPKNNGIAVLREQRSASTSEKVYTTIASGLARANSGYFGLTTEQIRLFEKLEKANFETFQETLGIRLAPAP